MKTCNICKSVKIEEEFYYNKCKSCLNARIRERYRKDARYRELRLSQDKEYRDNNREKKREKGRKHYRKNKERINKRNRKHYHENKYRISEKRKLRRKNNKAVINQKEREYSRKKWRTSSIHRLTHKLRSRIWVALKRVNVRKSERTRELIGCSYAFLKQHIESQWTEGMSWSNYGKHGWHIDHIKPISSFDLTIKEERLKCFHYTNMQPLWWRDNLEKGDKLDWKPLTNPLINDTIPVYEE